MAGNPKISSWTLRSNETRMAGIRVCSRALVLALFLGMAHTVLAETPYQGEGHVLTTPSDLDWQPVPSMAPGAEMAVLEGDLSKEKPFTVRIKLPADYTLAPHIHPEYERVTVLSGTFYFARGEQFDRSKAKALPEGSLAIMSPGDPMFGYTEEEVVIQLHGTGPWGIEYLDSKDDPRK
jgi:hypothetical protein